MMIPQISKNARGIYDFHYINIPKQKDNKVDRIEDERRENTLGFKLRKMN